MLSTVSLVAVAVIAAALAVAWSKRFLATGALVVANLVVFVLMAFGGTTTYRGQPIATIHAELGLTAANLHDPSALGALQLLTSMFVHADFFHILGNVIILLAFALPFEERIGHRPFLLLYVGSGLVGTLAQVGAYWGQPMLLMGASGAVFGIIGAFAAAYPRLVVPLPLPLFVIMIFVRMRVWVAAVIFGGLQLLYLATISNLDNTAYMAHIGGLAAGIVLSMVWVRSRGRPEDGPKPVRLHVGSLQAFAADAGTKAALQQMERNRDEPVVFQAWWERFWKGARDPATGQRVRPGKPGTVVREDGVVIQLDEPARL